MGKKRVIVIDDHQLFVDAVTAVIADDGDFEVVGTATSGRELVTLLMRTNPDVVLLDLCLPGPDGIACLALARERQPQARVIVLSAVEDPRAARRALDNGASAFVRKDIDPRDLVAVLRQTVEGTVVSQLVSSSSAPDGLDDARRLLTNAELAVLEALARGYGNKEIAATLSVAQQTVKFHLTNIYRKLGVANRTEAIRRAYEYGLVAEQPWAYEPAGTHH